MLQVVDKKTRSHCQEAEGFVDKLCVPRHDRNISDATIEYEDLVYRERLNGKYSRGKSSIAS